MTVQAPTSCLDLVVDTTALFSFSPIRILEIELSQVLSDLPETRDLYGRLYQKAIGIIRLHAQPLGIVEFMLNQGTLSAQLQADLIWQALGEQINVHLQEDNLDPIIQLGEQGISSQTLPACIVAREQFLADAPLASVIVCTHDRPDRLASCLRSLLTLHYPKYEIIIVDNAPTTTETFELIQQMQQDIPYLHYVREDQQGLSWARNRGILAAKGEILAFTDDDVVVDSFWLLELVRSFQTSDKVACVTGLVLPLELETQAQAWFEQFGGFSKGFIRCQFDLYEHHPKSPLFPYAAGKFGTGASIAFTASFMDQIGGFDLTLGTGSPTQGGEDLAMFFQVIVKGYTLVYEPSALVYHWHHRDYAVLCKQMHSYGVGLTAYLMSCIIDQPIRVFDFARKVPYGLFFAFSTHSPKNINRSADFPKHLIQLELKGMFYGPLAYLRSRKILSKLRG